MIPMSLFIYHFIPTLGNFNNIFLYQNIANTLLNLVNVPRCINIYFRLNKFQIFHL